MASSGKPSGPGYLANDHTYVMFVAEDFLPKEEYDMHRLQH